MVFCKITKSPLFIMATGQKQWFSYGGAEGRVDHMQHVLGGAAILVGWMIMIGYIGKA